MTRKTNRKKLYCGRRQPSIYSRTELNVVKKDFKKGFLVTVLVLAIAGLFYFLFFSPFFAIKNVWLSDLSYTDRGKIEQIVNEYKDHSLLNRNIITFNSGALKKELLEAGGIKTVVITKKYPDQISIKIEERNPSMVWQVIDRKYLVDENGTIWAPYDEKFTNIPMVADTKNVPVEIGSRVVSPKFTDFVQVLQNDFEAYTDSKINKMEVEETTEEIKVTSSEGWYAYFTTTGTAKNQLINLSRILKDNKGKKLEYVDLRIDNRIFYK